MSVGQRANAVPPSSAHQGKQQFRQMTRQACKHSWYLPFDTEVSFHVRSDDIETSPRASAV